MINKTLKQLRYFSNLAKYKNFVIAANACAVTQPAFSMQIKELESILGCALLEKGTRPIRLTEAGKKVLVSANEILRNIEVIEEFACTLKDSLISNLRVGVIPTIAPYFLPDFIQRLSLQFHDLRLYIREAITSQLISAVLDGRLDIAIVALPISEPNLTEAELFKEEFVLLRPLADAQ